MVDAIVNQKARPLHKGTGVQGTYRKMVNPVAMNLTLNSSDTESLALPLARRADNTRRPFAVAIRQRNPCLFFLFLLWG